MRVKSFLCILLIGILVFPSNSLAVMSSANYTIFADSIDAGGVLSTSGTYQLEDTLGEPIAGAMTSSTYEILGGYQAMDWSVLTIEVDTDTIDLGTLSTTQVASATAVVSVTASASSGYVLSVAGVSGTSLAAVTDGAVTAGAEEYGVAVTGSGAAFANDREVANGLNLAALSTPVSSAQTNLIFKAAISSASTAGSRSQSVTLAASTNL